MLIEDLARLFGCAVGLKESVTAITLVALGTSLPDTFASKAAAVGDSTADAAVRSSPGCCTCRPQPPWPIASSHADATRWCADRKCHRLELGQRLPWPRAALDHRGHLLVTPRSAPLCLRCIAGDTKMPAHLWPIGLQTRVPACSDETVARRNYIADADAVLSWTSKFSRVRGAAHAMHGTYTPH